MNDKKNRQALMAKIAHLKDYIFDTRVELKNADQELNSLRKELSRINKEKGE